MTRAEPASHGGAPPATKRERAGAGLGAVHPFRVLAFWVRACAAALLVCGGALCSGAGCGGAASGDANGDPRGASEIAQIHRAKCGACHKRIEPGERTRDVLLAALRKHRKRVRLTEAEWSKMVDYLAEPPAAATPR